jgi:benzoyl-CoA reductase subunit C
MDDLDTGSRYFWGLVDTSLEPLYALAKRYISHLACPRMFFWDRQVEQVIEWVKEYRIDGVINYPQIYSYPRHYNDPYFREKLTEAGIPVTTIFRDYYLVNVGQLRTRIGAFIETLNSAKQEEGTAP